MKLSIVKSWWLSIKWTRKNKQTAVKVKFVYFVAAWVFLVVPQIAWAENWEIDEWQASYYIWDSGVVSVTQDITAYFEGLHNTIDLYIPGPYTKGYGRVEVKNLHIYDQFGNELKESEMLVDYVFDRVNIDLFFTAENESRSWRLSYDLERSLQFSDKDLLTDGFYWSVIPAEQCVNIKKVIARVILPTAFDDHEVQQGIFIGPVADLQEGGEFNMSGNTLFYQGYNIDPWEEFNILARWPKGYVHLPDKWWISKVWQYLKFPYYALPVAVFAFLLIWFFKYGRDPRGKGKIVPQYEPPADLPPEHLGTLVEERVKIKFIISILINLAQRGYLHIQEESRQGLFSKSDYTFEKRRVFRGDPSLSAVELFFLESLFELSPSGGKASVKLSTLKNRFASKMNTIQAMIMQDLVDNRYFREHPGKLRFKYFIIAASLSCIGLPTWVIGGIVFHHIFAGAPLFICAFLFFIFAPLMPQKTKKGALAHEWAEGFRLFLKNAERYRLKKLTPDIFNKYLPYAMVFGLEKQWAQSFEGLLLEQPDWYNSSGTFTAFSTVDFSHALSSSFTHAASQTMQSVPGSHRTGLSNRFTRSGPTEKKRDF